MKQVWILNHYAKAPGEPGGTRHFHLAEHLKARGWRASLVAAGARDGDGKRTDARAKTCLETIEGVPFLWIKTPTYEGNGGGRIANMLAYSFRVLLRGTTKELSRPDIVVGSSVHPFAALAGALLARRFGVPFIFEVRDLWPQTLIDMGRLRDGSFTTWAMRQLEKWLYRRAARIVVLLPRASEYIVPLGIPGERIKWIPNGVDLSLFPRERHSQREDAQPFTLMYFGAHGQANGLETVLEAMRIVQDKRGAEAVRLRMIGNGPLKPALIEHAEKLALRNVSFEPPVPKQQIPEIAAQADGFVFNLIDAPVFKYGISSNKLFDFLAGARPIVFCCDSVNNPVEEAGAGLTVPPGRPAELADAIVRLVALPSIERERMGEAGRAYVEQNHDFSNLAERFADVLEDALEIQGKRGGSHPLTAQNE